MASLKHLSRHQAKILNIHKNSSSFFCCSFVDVKREKKTNHIEAKKFSFGFYFILFCSKNLIRSHNRIMCASLFRYPYYKTKSFILTYARDREKQKPTQLYVCVCLFGVRTQRFKVYLFCIHAKNTKWKTTESFFPHSLAQCSWCAAVHFIHLYSSPCTSRMKHTSSEWVCVCRCGRMLTFWLREMNTQQTIGEWL